MIPAGVESLTNAFLDDVPDHASWRTFTVSACAFPTSMGGVERHSHQFVERADWIAWRNNLHGRRGQLARLPSFGDCAIQHLQGVEGFDPRTMQVSASIRYAREQDWLSDTDRIRNLVDTEVFADARPHDAPGFAANATRNTA